MNEQIKELAHKAEFINKRHNGDEWRWGYIDPELSVKLEKFAELIVRECIQTLRDNTPVVDEHDSVEDWDRGYIRGMVDCEHHIKEHFGVEQ